MNRKYLIEQLRQPSTWRGIVALMTAFGLVTSPERQAAIITAGMALAGLVGVFFPDQLTKGKEQQPENEGVL